MAHKTCLHCGQWKRHVARGLCNACYKQAAHDYPRTNLSSEEWLAASKKTAAECWPWKGPTDRDGYGVTSYWRAHRWVYRHMVGPIPDQLQVDHQCNNRLCVNPAHLVPMTGRENVLRGDTIPAANLAKTHCMHGHEFTPRNTYVAPGCTKRQCRTCKTEWARRARSRR